MSRKKPATDKDVEEFLEAVFPGNVALAKTFFDEGHTLRTATEIIKSQVDLLRQCLEIIEEVDLVPAYDGRGDCCYCGQRKGHDKDCERLKAATLLPELRKVMNLP